MDGEGEGIPRLGGCLIYLFVVVGVHAEVRSSNRYDHIVAVTAAVAVSHCQGVGACHSRSGIGDNGILGGAVEAIGASPIVAIHAAGRTI